MLRRLSDLGYNREQHVGLARLVDWMLMNVAKPRFTPAKVLRSAH